MSRPEILNRLVAIIAVAASARAGPASVTEATSLESFAVDSLVLIDLIFDIEREFNVKLVVEQLTAMRTMGDLVGHLETRLGALSHG